MSLADELLADLEENDDAELETLIEEKSTVDHEFAVPYPVIPKEEDIKNVSIRELAKLRHSDRLKRVMTEIEHNIGNNRQKVEVTGLMETDPEYQLIVEANNIAVEIDGEIAIIHRYVRDKYQKRFPELESLIISPQDYIRAVRELGNDLDRAKNNETLQSFLTQATIMIVSVTASTTQGKLLTEKELAEINDACDMAADLNNFKSSIFEYVESRMAFIAPNITAIVGASTAAKILGVAGGLSKLAKMPSCNILPLGQQKKTLSGFSQAAALPHTGFIYFSSIVQDTPPELRYKAAKLVSTKMTLAARVDACHESTDGSIGRSLRESIEKKLDKMQEPPPVKFVKPLPKPIEQSRKKRGGKRVRKMKERYAMTEFRKNANRLNFADIEDDAYQEDLGYTRGTIGKSSTGRVRLPQIDEKTKVRISKTLQKNLQKQQQYGGATSIRRQVSGTASSVAFTPLQGLEIVNPQAAETRINEANAKYFSNTSGFLSVDLQLAAELGKTLLERNKELETALRQHQNVIEDQAQEIEYLTKQTVALREVNDSRLRIYEQLEVSIQDLERANHRLAVDHAADKKHIKTMCSNIETLESKCEELQKIVDDLNAQLEIYRRRVERKSEIEKPKEKEKSIEALNIKKPDVSSTPVKTIAPLPELTKEDEDLLRLSDELRENKVAFAQEQRRVTELEEQLASMIQENNRLQDQFRNWHHREDEPKSMHEEFSILEEVRQGQLCIRCLRGVERGDDMSSILDGDDDDRSAISSLILPASGQGSPREDLVTTKLVKFDNAKEKLLQGIWANKEDGHDNPYRELVEKYEALLEVQLSQVKNIRKNKTPLPNVDPSGPLCLQDELQTSSDYSQFNVKDTDEESGHGEEAQKGMNQTKKVETSRKKIIQTPDFSEAETSSSGFSDETSNKATQTERERPGSFLCTIADGEDYRFSIYDDVSPMDSRFRNRPEYRELFKEIFTILKKAAENKDEGEQLPLLDDTTAGKVPPVTPANEELPENFTDDTQSVLSSVMSEQSIPVSDITVPDTPPSKEKDKPKVEIKTRDEKSKNKDKPVTETTTEKTKPIMPKEKEQTEKEHKEKDEKEKEKEKERVLTPLVRQPLEYIAATRKKSRHRNRKHSQERQGADSPVFPSPPKITYQKSSNKKRRDYRPIEVSPLVRASETEWNGSTLQFYNRNLNSPTPSASGRTGKIYQGWNSETDSWDIKQSTASQEIHKLRKLELSYAEVLRNADKTKTRRKKHQ